jgi:Uma2 family endonuclease
VNHWQSANREDAFMAESPIDPPTISTLADIRERLGGIPLDRIRFRPAPGTATEKDVIEAEARDNRLYEVVDGTLVEKAVGFEEARLAARLVHLVNSYLDKNDLGVCIGANGMMRIAPGLVRIPGVSFITWDRLPGRESPREPIPVLTPDLAVEVLSEGNTEPEMTRKVREYFEAGVILVWLIDPKKRTARIFSSVDNSSLIRADQSLDGGEVLPGFVLPLADFLDRGRRPRGG